MRTHRVYTRTRRTEALEIRKEAAELAASRAHPDHLSNGEESEYRRPDGDLSYIANYSKGFPHNPQGEVNRRAYRGLLRAIYRGDPDNSRRIRLGMPTGRRLTNPQAGF